MSTPTQQANADANIQKWQLPSFSDVYEGTKSFAAPRWNFTVATATHTLKTVARVVTTILLAVADLVTLIKDEICHAALSKSWKELKYNGLSIPGSIVGIIKPNWGEKILPTKPA